MGFGRSGTTRVVLHGVVALVVVIGGVVAFYLGTLYTAGPPQTGTLALTGATVLAGEDLEPRPATTVLVRDGRIVALGPDAHMSLPPDAVIMDLGGLTLMPGLMDLHVHMGAPELGAGEKPGPLFVPRMVADWLRFMPARRRAFLEHGITTVRSLGDEPDWILEFRHQVAVGGLEGPRLFVAGPLFTTQRGHPIQTLGTDPASDMVRLPGDAAAARRAVRDLATARRAVDLIKVVQERGGPDRPLEPMSRAVLAAIVAEAHDHGIPVVAHWGTLEDMDDALAAGVDGLEHLETRQVLDGWPNGTLEALLQHGAFLAPTLTVSAVALPADAHTRLRARLGEFHAAGGRVVAGSDAGMPGIPFGAGLHRELELLVESGLTPRAALKAATSDAASALGKEDIGVIAPGRRADLIALRGVPHRDIRHVRQVVLVFRDGRIAVDRRAAEVQRRRRRRTSARTRSSSRYRAAHNMTPM